MLVTIQSLDAEDQVIDSDSQLLRDSSAVQAETDLLTLAGEALRYRFELKKYAGSSPSVELSELKTEKTSFVDL
jgi:hypothetical protein